MPLSANLLSPGEWLPGQVSCHWVPSTFSPSPETSALIESAWRETQSRRNVILFDGPMCRLERFTAKPDRLDLFISRTSYKAFVGTNLSHPELADRLGLGTLANALGISCAVISSDNFLLLGQRNARVAYYPNRIHPFAGTLEPADPLDIFEEARRELAEELRFTPADIKEMKCVAIVEDQALRQPELICLVWSTLSRSQIESRVEKSEHDGLVSIPADENSLRQAMTMPLLTPVARAAIELTIPSPGTPAEG